MSDLRQIVISPVNVMAAGVLLREGDRFVFGYGPHRSGGVYVLRIGGHREGDESPWECALREAHEEASAVVRQIPANATVQTSGADGPIATLPQPIVVEGHPEERPLVVGGTLEPGTENSTLFLAETDDESRPSAEMFGLVKLTTQQVMEVAGAPLRFAAIAAAAIAQDAARQIANDTPIVVSSHLRALAFCLERGYV